MSQSYSRFLLLFWFVSCGLVYGLAPHEVVVIANRGEAGSVRIAQSYLRQWNVPRQNLILLQVPPGGDGEYVSLSADAFSKQIWQPVQETIARRRLDHVLAWVYSTHIPFRIEHDPPLSIHGLTFLRNRIPEKDAIARAEYSSPLFAGPSAPGGVEAPTQSFYPAAQTMLENMPLPSMSLGYVGERGNTEAEVLAMLQRSVQVHGRGPTGTVYFVTSDDIRSRVREWQFGPVVQWLSRIGVPAVVTNAIPQNAPAILGMTLGTATFDATTMGRFVPGSLGEHLTSFGATFDQANQTKISRWISVGASGTAGTVSEPYAIWAKFPHARFWEHYRGGGTLIESLYLSLRSPLQTYLIGDPLVAPWSTGASLQISGIEDGALLREPISIDLHLRAPYGVRYTRFVYLVNGVVAGSGTEFTLRPGDYEPGLHELRAVAYVAGFVQSPVTATVRFRTEP